MAATVSVKECNGGSTSGNTITNSRLCTNDVYNPGTSWPMVKPSAGTNRSFWKTHFLNVDSGLVGTINNVKWYTDASTTGWTGVFLFAGQASSYTKATGTTGTTGDDSGVATTSAHTLTSGAPLDVPGEITASTGMATSAYVVIQADVSTAAVAGTLAGATLTWRYDET